MIYFCDGKAEFSAWFCKTGVIAAENSAFHHMNKLINSSKKSYFKLK